MAGDSAASGRPRKAHIAAPTLLLGELQTALIFETTRSPIWRIAARILFGRFVGTLINPERFVEPQKADAGKQQAGNLEGGESLSGLEPSRAEKPQVEAMK
jgi:hypothetical protein